MRFFPAHNLPGQTPLRRYFALAVIALTSLHLPAFAAPGPELCERAARRAAQHSGVPLPILRAVMFTESGRQLAGRRQAWPWTVNMEGEGHWFDTEEQARAYVTGEHARGARSFDIGCFQINFRWHGKAFASIAEMFRPEHNALYAADLLRRHYGELGDWSRAAGQYHSRTPEKARIYQARFERILAALAGPAGTSTSGSETGAALHSQPAAARSNDFPLLHPGRRGSPASLVPLGATAEVTVGGAGGGPAPSPLAGASLAGSLVTAVDLRPFSGLAPEPSQR